VGVSAELRVKRNCHTPHTRKGINGSRVRRSRQLQS
jgi:hypothetical protein